MLFGNEPNDFVKAETARILHGATGAEAGAASGAMPRVLCLAEGEGRNALHLAALGCRVLAVDASAVGLQKASAWARRRSIPVVPPEELFGEESERGALGLMIADLSQWNFGNAEWDAIVCTFGHFPPPVRRRVLQEVRRALKPGGFFLAEFYRPAQLGRGTGGPSDAAWMVSANELREQLAEGSDAPFEILQETEREIDEGTAHRGLSATVQVAYRRPIL
jgi:SAM-dependent methyltransferase